MGVVLCVPELAYLDLRMSKDNDAPKRLFGRNAFDDVQLDAAKSSLQSRIRTEGLSWKSADDLADFARREANQLRLTKPRTILTADPDQDLHELCRRLVRVSAGTR